MNGRADTARPSLDRATFALALIQCVLQPIPHVTALENLTFYPMLVCTIWLALARGRMPFIRTPIVASVLALSAFLVVVSVLGPYPLESMNAWRKDFLPPLAVFFALLLTVTSSQRVATTLLAIIAGPALRLTLIGVEVLLQHPLISGHPGFVHPYSGSIVPSAFFGGFALGAAIYAPVIAATLLRKDLPGWGRYMAWYALAGCTLFVINYGSRTPMIAMCAGFLVIIVTTRSRRLILLAAAIALAVSAHLYWNAPDVANRYGSIFSGKTYSNGIPNQGITIGDRLRIWKGIVEVADQRPMLGYGYGWKKLSYVVRDEGFLDRWRSDPAADAFTVAYFSRGYGGINPHNLLVHLYFEGGYLGILLFVVMLSTLVWACFQLHRRSDLDTKILAILTAAFIASWLVANVGNSIWAGEKLPFVVMALVAAMLLRPETRTANSSTSPLGQPGGTEPHSILVIRRDNIGDLVCTTPLLTALRRRHPEATICVLANTYNAGVLRGNPDIDACFAYCKLKHRLQGESAIEAIWQRLKLIAELRRRHFDVVILAKSGFDKHGLRFARQIGASRVIGFAHPDGRSVPGLTEAVPLDSGLLRHEVEALAELGARLGVKTPLPALTIVADPATRDQQQERVMQHARNAGHMVALHISARERSRRWTPDKVVSLIKALTSDSDVVVSLMWAPGAGDDPRHPGDDLLAEEICAQTQGLPVIPTPTRNLDELVAALSLCSTFIGADGGAMHVAAGLGLPVVGLFENSEFKLRHWYPWGVPHELVHATSHDVAGIEVADVFAAWQRLQPFMKRA